MHRDIMVCAKLISHRIIRPCVYDFCLPLVLYGGAFIDSAPFLHTCNFSALVFVVSANRSATVCHVHQICADRFSESSDLCCQSNNLGIFCIKFRISVGSNHIVQFCASSSCKIIMRHIIIQSCTRINIIFDSLD